MTFGTTSEESVDYPDYAAHRPSRADGRVQQGRLLADREPEWR